MLQFTRPRIPTHYSIWSEPPDDSGEEVLRIASSQRSLKLKGHSFREFQRHVVPLLDGRHSLDEIHERTADLFRREDLEAALDTLGRQGIVVEDEGQPDAFAAPQANFMRDLGQDPGEVERRLAAATVAVVGVGAMGAETAMTLAAAGVGGIVAVDVLPVSQGDASLSTVFAVADVGRPRVESLAGGLAGRGHETRLESPASRLETEEDVAAAIAGADFVVSCLDPGLVNLSYKLNKVCHASRQPWISAHQDGPEVVVGPDVVPGETACFMCFRMRTIACSGNPENAFAYERHLDRTRHDLSEGRQNLIFAVGIAANILGLETVKHLTGFAPPALTGRVLTVNLLTLQSRKHTLLRKPWCPVCHGGVDAG